MKLARLLPAIALVVASQTAHAAYQLNVSIALSPPRSYRTGFAERSAKY